MPVTTNTRNNSSSDFVANAFSSFDSAWASFSAYNLDIASLLASLLSINGMLYLFDYIYRTLQTIRIVRKFWSKGVVKMPAANMTNKSKEFNWRVLNSVHYALEILPYIWLQVLFTMCCVVIIAWSVACENV